MEILQASHLCKTYGKGENEVRALDDVSFSIEKGEFVAIVGTSGSGKSTLMHILGGSGSSRQRKCVHGRTGYI